MSKFIEFTNRDEERGALVTVHRPFSNIKGSIFVPNSVLKSEALGAPANVFLQSLKTFTLKANKVSVELSEIGWKNRSESEAADMLKSAKALRNAAIERKKDNTERREKFLKPLKPLDPIQASEIRQWARTQKPAEVMRMCLANADIAAAILEFNTLSGLSRDLLSHVEDSLIEHNLCMLYAAQTPKKADLDDVLATGYDQEKCKRIAAEARSNLEQSVEEVKDVEAVLNNTIDFYAVVVDGTRNQALENLIQ